MTLKDDIGEIRRGLREGRYTDERKVCEGIVRRLLHALDWSVFDIQVVISEYPVEERRVDFALCHPPLKPQVFIEAKKVGLIDESAERQLFEYAFHEGVPILILTDGKEWHFFYTSGPGVYNERRVYKLDLVESDSEESAARFNRYLSYESIRSGAAIQAIEGDYRNISKQRQMKNILPEAWTRLVQESDEFLLDVVAEKAKDLCGDKPNTDLVLDFLKSLESRQTIEIPFLPEPEKPPGTTGRKAPTRLVVTMNGDKIDYPNGADTFVEVIKRLGIERVKNLGVAWVSTSEPQKYHSRKIGQNYIVTWGPSTTKKNRLEEAARKLGVPIEVTIVEK